MLLFRPYEQGALPGGYGLLARMLHGYINSTATDVSKVWRNDYMDNMNEVLTPWFDLFPYRSRRDGYCQEH